MHITSDRSSTTEWSYGGAADCRSSRRGLGGLIGRLYDHGHRGPGGGAHSERARIRSLQRSHHLPGQHVGSHQRETLHGAGKRHGEHDAYEFSSRCCRKHSFNGAGNAFLYVYNVIVIKNENTLSS